MEKLTDKEGHNELYKGAVSHLITCDSKEKYRERFRKTGLSPFCKGGGTKSYVRGLTVESIFKAIDRKNIGPDQVTILDARCEMRDARCGVRGAECGQGELSVWLSANGFHVIGVDISEEACISARKLAESIGIDSNCRFLDESLESLPLDDKSIDFIIGHAALHHFIKYKGVATELGRVLKNEGEMFFADSFGENKIYHIFHNKEQMYRLGDVILTRKLIHNFFHEFEINITPTDWFVMLDKLLLKIVPEKGKPLIRALSVVWWHMDRFIPVNSVTLYLSGAVITHVSKY